MDERRNLGSRLVRALVSAGIDPGSLRRLCDVLESGLAQQTVSDPHIPVDLPALSTVVARICKDYELITYGALQVLTAAELADVPEMGPKRIGELSALLPAGARFRKSGEDFLARATQIYGDRLQVPAGVVLVHVLRYAVCLLRERRD